MTAAGASRYLGTVYIVYGVVGADFQKQKAALPARTQSSNCYCAHLSRCAQRPATLVAPLSLNRPLSHTTVPLP